MKTGDYFSQSNRIKQAHNKLSRKKHLLMVFRRTSGSGHKNLYY
ncbi:hypothetical protein ECDEC14D_1034 [Escherichia coli DEC14D]|nr:hypothetical protein ECDEC14D_1034 [Escherichia coli DEC14D]EMX17214.1 hypothetical protein ECP03022932_0332 [Escherichia coli P0302293.2]ENE32788.1 hypothetical protein ECP03022934_0327 [Escherichia coli P0302293.4]